MNLNEKIENTVMPMTRLELRDILLEFHGHGVKDGASAVCSEIEIRLQQDGVPEPEIIATMHRVEAAYYVALDTGA